MTLDLSDGRNKSKEFLKKELSSKISAQVFQKGINQENDLFASLLCSKDPHESCSSGARSEEDNR